MLSDGRSSGINLDLISLHLHKWVCQTQLDSLLKEQGVANAFQASTITKTSNAPPHFLRQRFKHQTRRSELAELQGSVQEGFTAAIVFVQTLGGKRQSYTLRALQYAMGISWNIISHSQHVVCASCAGPCGSKIHWLRLLRLALSGLKLGLHGCTLCRPPANQAAFVSSPTQLLALELSVAQMLESLHSATTLSLTVPQAAACWLRMFSLSGAGVLIFSHTPRSFEAPCAGNA